MPITRSVRIVARTGTFTRANAKANELEPENIIKPNRAKLKDYAYFPTRNNTYLKGQSYFNHLSLGIINYEYP